MPLSPNQLKAVDLLLVEPSVATAAGKLGVDTSTVYRWLREDREFRVALSLAQREAVRHNLRGITSMAGQAIKTISELMVSAKDEEIRLKAAQEALERLFDADLVMRADEGSEPEEVPGPA